MFDNKVGIRAEYQLTVKKSTGEVVQQTGVSKNIITNFAFTSEGLIKTGLTRLIPCLTDSAVEPTIDNHLYPDSKVKAAYNIIDAGTALTYEEGEYIVSKLTNETRFDVGRLDGTYSEIGLMARDYRVEISREYMRGLVSRTLIKDHRGIPTPIVVAQDEFVDCITTIYLYFKKETRGTVPLVARDNSLIKNVGYRLIIGKNHSGRISSSDNTNRLLDYLYTFGDGYFNSGKLNIGPDVQYAPADWTHEMFSIEPKSIQYGRDRFENNSVILTQATFLTILQSNFPIRVIAARQRIFNQSFITWIIFDEPIEKTSDMIMDLQFNAIIGRKV